MAAKEPTSDLFAGTGLGLQYVGKDHCYAFSGGVAALNTLQTVFDFTSGNHYIVATLTMTAPVKMTTAGISGGRVRGYQLDFNSQTVELFKVDSDSQDMPTMIEAQILIPPSTAVVLTCVDSATEGSYFGTANITGRVYGAE